MLPPRVVVLTISSAWRDEETVRGFLRKLHDTNPFVALRTTASAQGGARAGLEFAEALGLKFQEFPPASAWSKNASEIRIATMLTGLEWSPIRSPDHDGPVTKEIGPPADLVVAFWNGNPGITQQIIKKQLGRCQPVVVYREKWKKNKYADDEFQYVERAETNPKKKNQLKGYRRVTEHSS